ncbi:unnamed protein product [Durusdinium trenchii]|uniref:Ubiquitin-like domain-containing protein n=1 Tax=Durusdinium trenchii TaxID=1381693 RepID=A0ABP0PNY8_9DINO
MTSMRTPIRFLSGEIVDELEADDFDAIVQAEKPVMALKRHLAALTGIPRFRQQLLQDRIHLLDDASLTSDLELQLVILDFQPIDLMSILDFILACCKGDAVQVEEFLQKPIDPNSRDPHKEVAAPLWAAADSGSLEVVRLLLEARADMESTVQEGSTALQAASGKEHLEVVRELLQAGANKNAAALNGFTALKLASSKGYVEVVQELLKAGAETESLGRNDKTALHLASLKGHLEVVQELLASRADTNATAGNSTALHLACGNGHLGVVQELLKARADQDAVVQDGKRPLHFACIKGYPDLVRELLVAGADKNPAARDGHTPLHGATAFSHLEVVRELLMAGADENAAKGDGCTALHLAAQGGDIKMTRLLLEFGIHTESQRHDGATALYLASQGRYRLPKSRGPGAEVRLTERVGSWKKAQAGREAICGARFALQQPVHEDGQALVVTQTRRGCPKPDFVQAELPKSCSRSSESSTLLWSTLRHPN